MNIEHSIDAAEAVFARLFLVRDERRGQRRLVLVAAG
jgi:hypothetical protein